MAKNTALLKANEDYFFRVGAVSSFAGAKFNYATAVQINVGEVIPEVEPEGTLLDDCESIEGWAGGPELDSTDPREGNYSLRFQTNNGFIIQRNFDEPVNANVGLEYGVFQFYLYIDVYKRQGYTR